MTNNSFLSTDFQGSEYTPDFNSWIFCVPLQLQAVSFVIHVEFEGNCSLDEEGSGEGRGGVNPISQPKCCPNPAQILLLSLFFAQIPVDEAPS